MGICFTVPTAETALIERFGKFNRLATPGLNCLCFILGDSIAGRKSLKVMQLDVRVETKTRDNVFVTMVISVQYKIEKDQVYQAFYTLNNDRQQITAYVFDVVRASVPKLDLDDVFEQKGDIAETIKGELSNSMKDFGFNIHQALVTDIEPDAGVKKAMNEINAARRLRDAATDRAEADKILVVKAAEAEAESKYLSGVGIARQRRAIVDGLRDSVMGFTESLEGTTSKDVMDLVLITQYFDTLKEIGASSKSNTVFLSHAPGNFTKLQDEIAQGFMTGSAGAISQQPR